jgi:hypothetical protein
MITRRKDSPSTPPQQDDNRYNLVNAVAQRAKRIMADDPDPVLTHHFAIREAIEQIDDPGFSDYQEEYLPEYEPEVAYEEGEAAADEDGFGEPELITEEI